ncbi:hypothetical protein [Caulobacter sp. CCUG 60055]|uniref:hypothetical protein n=1 Tax=Caulobacter sp. CCUG 60055 TaxID=2100090 RepID=UPI001FA71E4D|nr:hypothetical protein [Caulobacter sp. CCUG 60055]MBQ1540946.1 hypothetical protein [Caulobacteraceae bacterium]
MARFSSADAALEGFRLGREHPGALAAWTGVFFIGNLATALANDYMTPRSVLVAFNALRQANPPDLAAMVALLPSMAPVLIVSNLLGVLTMAIVAASAFRLYLHRSRPATLSFGSDEWRILRLLLIVFLVGFVAVTAVKGLLSVALTLLQNTPAGVVVHFLGDIASFLIPIVVFVRLAPAAALAIDEHRIALREPWRLTRNVFWRLTGAYLLAAVMYLVVFVAVMVLAFILMAVVVLSTGGALSDVGAALAPDTSTLAGYFTFGAVVSQVFYALMQTVLVTIMTGVALDTYKAFVAHHGAGMD